MFLTNSVDDWKYVGKQGRVGLNISNNDFILNQNLISYKDSYLPERNDNKCAY